MTSEDIFWVYTFYGYLLEFVVYSQVFMNEMGVVL